MNLLVITPTLGRSAWLAETANSLSGIPADILHLLVCPPGEVHSLQIKYPTCKVVEDAGAGMYNAINLGLSTTDDWDAFTYINDDDYLLPDFKAIVERMSRAPKSPHIIYGRLRLVNTEGRRIGSAPIAPSGKLAYTLYEQGIESVYQQGTLTNRSALDAVGNFDSSLRYIGDTEWLARAVQLGIPFIRGSGREVAAFRLRPGQLSKDVTAVRSEREQVEKKLRLRVKKKLWRHYSSNFLFRAFNVFVYADRIRRHGWVSSRNLTNHG